MRVLIHPDYDQCSLWAANYIVYRIKAFRPTAISLFCLGLAYRFNTDGHTYREPHSPISGRKSFLQKRCHIQYGRIRRIAAGTSAKLSLLYA